MITIYPNHYETENPRHIDLDLAFHRIKTGKQAETIQAIREGNKKKKKDLPLILFSGVFDNRKDDSLRKHSGYIVLDFDHIDVPVAKQSLSDDEYVKACWVSPSGDGLKALVKIDDPTKHRAHFRAMCNHFSETHGLLVDQSGINESRGCYESYDPDIHIKPEGKVFTKTIENAVTPDVPTSDDTDYSKLYLAACIIRKAPDGGKHEALLKASILLGGFIAARRVEESEAVRVLEKEIAKRNVDSMETARNTIADGIRQGKLSPLAETIEAEQALRREMMLTDGDMSFMSDDTEDFDWIIKFRSGDFETGLSTGNTILDRNYRFKKEFTMISGHSSIGKTTFMLYMIVSSAINHDWRWVIYSSENNTALIKMRLIQFATGKTIQDLSKNEIATMMKWVKRHFVLIDNSKVLSYEDVLLYCEKVSRKHPIDGLLIDPYNSLKITTLSMGGVHEYHYQAASEFLTFSNRMKIAVWVNAHSVTSAIRAKGDDGLPVAPGAEDTEHGGKWVNRADCFLTLHRKIHHPSIDKRREIEFHVRKVRNQETGGEPTPFDTPYIFKMSMDGTCFEMIGPFGRLFNHIQATDVDKQMRAI